MLRLCSFLSSTALHSRHFPFIDGALQLHKLRLAHQQMSEDLRELQQQGPLNEMHRYPSSNKSHMNPTVLQQSASSSSSPPLQGRKKKAYERMISPKKKNQSQNGPDQEVMGAIEAKKSACLVLENEFFREVEAFRPVFTMSASLEVSKEYSQFVYRALCYFGLKDDPLMRQMAGVVSRSMLRRRAGEAVVGSFATMMPPSSSSSLHTSHSLTRSTSLVSSSSGSHGAPSPLPHEDSGRREPCSTPQRRKRREEEGGISTTSSSFSSSSSSPSPIAASSSPSFFSTFRNGEEGIVSTLPTELPNPPQVFTTATLEYTQRRRPGGLRIPAAHRGHWVLQEPEIAITREERKEDPW